jgi:undecaprenyl-phosphate alpha-N-acetylglucosaminyl 1-phosphatetransferase
MIYLYVLCAGILLSGVTIRLVLAYAPRLGLIDRPGEHKQHTHITPFVGGFGIFAALLGGLALMQAWGNLPGMSWWPLAAGGALMFATGLVDDILRLGFKIRLVLQTLAALIMIQAGGVLLTDLGNIGPMGSIELGWLAVPFTVLATVGVINAMNMIDGIDGLSGSLSFISLFLLVVLATGAGQSGLAILALALAGGALGFLYFNLRYGHQHRARVFMGDNGTMLLGFLFAWLFIGLSQGPARAMTPVTALWLFSIPLMDTVGVMLRRIWMGRSPFRPDRYHLHHLFLRAGFTVKDTTLAIVMLHLALGGIGVAAYWAGVSEQVLFLAFLGVFAVFFYLILRPWRFVPALRKLHTLLGLASPETRGVFIGHFPPAQAAKAREHLSNFSKGCGPHQLQMYQTNHHGASSSYLVLELACEDTDMLVEEVKGVMRRLKREYAQHGDIQVRHYVQRSNANDRRAANKHAPAERRRRDRRQERGKVLLYPTGNRVAETVMRAEAMVR